MQLSEIKTTAPEDADKKKIKEETASLLKNLDELQNVLFAENKHCLLVIFQGMDASGKDGAINKIFRHINPQGVYLTSFKEPSAEEIRHDFLWRIHKNAPATGMIHVFNRSHYEDVLISRIHGWCTDETARLRFKAINQFEEFLSVHNSTTILKFYLHISKEEQQRRFSERLEDERKRWKYTKEDEKESQYREQYLKMYEDVFLNCNQITWNIIPSDQNWYKIYLITKIMVDSLSKLDMKYPSFK